VAQYAEDADVLLTAWGSPPITKEVLQNARSFRLIADAAGSVKFKLSLTVLQQCLIPQSIRVFSVNGVVTLNVAEVTMITVLARCW
jgi:phosphoglycerate dehydrogenase-like enzyme